ncbi:FecR domain-containing protein [uncultured Bacteroides sp.]|uniref:FecR family protein n=1 Tax=uncultured Bacteroides sp. TaxID=162156 RepID=UPI002AA80D0E|nr:FecR domain-containing protein [uncultured Bacteroides sp.]
METNMLESLLMRYIKGECNSEERETLARMVKSQNDSELKRQLEAVWLKYDSLEHLSDERSQEILSTILVKKSRIRRNRRWMRHDFFIRIGSIAAVLLLLLGIGYYIKQAVPEESIIITSQPVSLSENTSYVRSVVLPDGSLVVLQANSTIELLPSFDKGKREVRLSGEAYFDIKRNAKRPFVIYSGELKTTVLGTAFNIAAWPNEDQIRVAVTRGKVRIENTETKNILADLSRNEEIEYDKSKSISEKHTEVAATQKIIDWTKQDMEFNGMSLKDIAVILSKRYGADIEIHGNKLANALIVASFVGTESLENVLNVLCPISSSSYSMESGKVVIDQSE